MRPLGNLLTSRKRLAPVLALLIALAALAVGAAGVAYAYFTATVASGGNGGAVSGSLPQGSTPEVSLSGANVTVTWTQSTVGGQLLGAYAGGGYKVKRYPASGEGGVTPGTSCNATVSGASEKLSCTESNVPPGSWKYTVTPVLNNWVGAESAQSAAVYRSSIALSPSSGGAGTIDSISGSGFAPNSTITATFGGSSVTLGGTTKTDGSGNFTGATYTVPGDAAGSYEVVVSDGSSHSASASYQVTFGPASQIVLSGSTESLVSGSGRTYTATIEDAAGNSVTGGSDSTDNITFNQTTSTGSVSGLTTVAAIGGTATDLVTGNKAGSVSLQASGTINSTAMSSNTLSFTVVAGAPATVVVQSGSPQSSTVNTSFSNVLVALVTDANSNPVPGVSVTFTAPSSGASGTFANGKATVTATTASNGQATASAFTANTVAGSYTVSASVSGVSASTSFSLTNNPGAATKLAFTPSTPGPGIAGESIPTVAVSVEDSFGNVVSSQGSGSVSISIKAGSAQGSFTSGTTTASVSKGVASFTNLVVDTSGSYTFTATPSSIGGVTSAVNSSTFTVSPAAASKLAFTTEPSGAVNKNSVFPTQPVIAVEDTFGNKVSTDSSSVTLTLNNPEKASLICNANPVTASSGVASFASCKINKDGTFSLHAADGTLTATDSSNIVVTG